jgi:endogenous inhibitor of DNA gyrase (YacG/DUF329 family)
MAGQRHIKVSCPTCKKQVKLSDPEFPFCSERCRLLDLGKWASGEYVVSTPLRDTSDAVGEQGEEDD